MILIVAVIGALPAVSAAEEVIIKENLAEERVTDVMRARKLVASRSFILFKRPKYGHFLEGYLTGFVTDYDDRPIEGVVVRALVTATESGKKKGEEDLLLSGESLEEGGGEKVHEFTPHFEAGISDADGVYRIHFSVPIIKRKVDIRGKIIYNPGWNQQHDVLGQSYEPQMKESPFRFYYDEKTKVLAFAEGSRKVIVRPVRNVAGPVSPIKLKGSEKPETAEPKGGKAAERSAPGGAKPVEQKEEDDFFKTFNFGP
ncbi:MAG: hypothetical protein HYT79_10460 [Elusimicrobia bacterium]|nr:hypothetical protein [Elusimicrobiota bacterium]